MTDTTPNHVITCAWEAAAATTDLPALEQFLAPDARWLPVWDDAPGCHGRTEIVGFMRQSLGGSLQGHIEESTAFGSRVVVGFRPVQPPDDRPLDCGLAYVVVTVEHGKITEIKGCATRATAEAYAQA